jgi:hypothetical protein
MKLREDIRVRMSQEMELAECIKDGRMSVELSMKTGRFGINRDSPCN